MGKSDNHTWRLLLQLDVSGYNSLLYLLILFLPACSFLLRKMHLLNAAASLSPTDLPPNPLSKLSRNSPLCSHSNFPVFPPSLPEKPQPKAPPSSSLLSPQVQAAQAFLSQNLSHRSTADHLSLCSALSKISSSYGLLKAKTSPSKKPNKSSSPSLWKAPSSFWFSPYSFFSPLQETLLQPSLQQQLFFSFSLSLSPLSLTACSPKTLLPAAAFCPSTTCSFCRFLIARYQSLIGFQKHCSDSMIANQGLTCGLLEMLHLAK